MDVCLTGKEIISNTPPFGAINLSGRFIFYFDTANHIGPFIQYTSPKRVKRAWVTMTIYWAAGFQLTWFLLKLNSLSAKRL